MLNARNKLKSEKTIAAMLNKSECDVDFQESRVLPSPPWETSVMVKADGIWFDVTYIDNNCDVLLAA